MTCTLVATGPLPVRPKPNKSMPQERRDPRAYLIILFALPIVLPVLYSLAPESLFSLTTSTPNPSNTPAMSWFQKTFTLPSRSRGSYLITDTVVKELPEIKSYKIGLLNLFVQHTSCALSMNENWDDDVRADMSDALDRIVPEVGAKGEELYRHSAEGRDDMPVSPLSMWWPGRRPALQIAVRQQGMIRQGVMAQVEGRKASWAN
jgi:thiamine phosphate synthase YjbQ (UPF0047 family)